MSEEKRVIEGPALHSPEACAAATLSEALREVIAAQVVALPRTGWLDSIKPIALFGWC